MLLVLAALLAAGDPVAEFSLAAAAGTRGERRAEAVARAGDADLTLSLGAAELSGPLAPDRQEVLLGAQSGVVRGELRLVPQSAGLLRAGGEVGVHFETVGLILGARTATLGSTQLRGAGARLEVEGQLTDELRGGLSASAWALQLDAASPRDAWVRWGNATLDWAQRWETGLWISQEFGELLSLTPALSVAQPAQPGAFEARAALAVEVPLGSLKLRAETAVARQWPELWLVDVTAGVSMRLY
jgi:hypothetical protein